MKINWPDGLDEAGFLQQYWQQKPLLIPQAFAGFSNPIDPDELAGLACDPDSNARFMQRVKGDEWRMCPGPLSDDFFDDVSGSDWSLLVSDVEKLLPDFRDYLQPFRFIPDWRIDDLMISYAPVGGSVGAHVDQYDVFLLQSSGVREWQIETSRRSGQQQSVSSDISLLVDFEADQIYQLKAGDMLYLPPRFAHHGIAREEACMTWSVGFRAPSVDEMLPAVVNYFLESINTHKRFTDPERKVTPCAGRIDEADLQQLRKMLRTAFQQDDHTLSEWIGRHLSESRLTDEEPEPNDTDWPEIHATLGKNNTLVANSHKNFLYKEQGRAAILFADGLSYRCSIKFAESLCNTRQINYHDITTEDQAIVVALYNQHNLLLEERGQH
ncbi:hypothetical protein AB833_31495 [Chromatiales bacterium (ex Bugula neritina AB1)]|nr:hypothetical protein AB833_31495 [Chromatiales bacterium (ex Bugula neritina AB1)]